MKNLKTAFQTISLALLFVGSLQTQSLPDLLTQLENSLAEEVLVGKTTTQQSIGFTTDAPFRLKITKTEENTRGKTQSESAEVNLGIIKRVRVSSDRRKGINLILSSGNIPCVKVYQDGEVDSYEKEYAIQCQDIDNARALEEILEQALPLAQSAWETATQVPATLSELQSFIAERVENVAYGEDTYEQSLEFKDAFGTVDFFLGGSMNKDKQEQFHLLMGDLNTRETSIETRGQQVMVRMTVKKKQKFIARTEEKTSFVNSFDIFFTSFDDAQIANYAIQALIPLSEQAYTAQLPVFSAITPALSDLRTIVRDTDLEEASQSLTTDCLTAYSFRDEDGQTTKYTFDFADIDKKLVEIAPKGNLVLLELKTENRNKYIRVDEDEEQKNYTASLALSFTGVDAAKKAQTMVSYLAAGCPEEVEAPGTAILLTLLTNAELEGGDLEQSVNLIGDQDCKMELTLLENSNKPKEIIREFNIFDLDADSEKIIIKGTEVSLTYYTNGKEEIIQELINEEEQTYTNQVFFHAPDLQTAKTLNAGINALIAGCSEEK